jgi:hypothetical protein
MNTNKEEIIMDNDKLDEMIKAGLIGVMTECAYGAPIAQTEKDNVLKKKNSEDLEKSDK